MEQLFNFDNSPYEFKDLETGATIKLHPNSVKDKYLTKLKDYQNNIQNFCRAHNIAHVPYNLSEPISKILLEYLQKRSKMM